MAGIRQGWYERAYQRGLDGFRSNAEDTREEGEGKGFGGTPQHVSSSLTARFAVESRLFQMIRERVTSGIRAAQANGKQLGRPKRVCRRDLALSMREAGMSWRKIAAALEWPR